MCNASYVCIASYMFEASHMCNAKMNRASIVEWLCFFCMRFETLVFVCLLWTSYILYVMVLMSQTGVCVVSSSARLMLHVQCYRQGALFNPKTSIFIQKRHPYTGNLNPETPGHSKNAFIHWGYVLRQKRRPQPCQNGKQHVWMGPTTDCSDSLNLDREIPYKHDPNEGTDFVAITSTVHWCRCWA